MKYYVDGLPECLPIGTLDIIILHAVDFLGIGEEALQLEIVFEDELDDVCGDADYEDGVGYITISSALPLQEMVATILHEMVHIHQAIRGDLIVDGLNRTWQGQIATEANGYLGLPWEEEAYRLESEMLKLAVVDGLSLV